MKKSLLSMLCCNKCSGDLSILDVILEPDVTEIETGTLTCTVCGQKFPIIHGVPSFSFDSLANNITAKGFSEQWDSHKQQLFEKEDVFGLTVDDYIAHFCYAFGVDSHRNLDGVIIEAGVGSGCLIAELAKASPKAEFIGIDISDVVFSLSSIERDTPNLHLIQCDLVSLPLKKGIADMVYSSGVLHHIPSPSTGISSLWKLVKKGGKFYFWVYPSYVYCAYDNLRKILGRPFMWPRKIRYLLSWLLAPVLWLYFFKTKRYSYKQTQESVSTIAFRIFDNISPEFQHRVSKVDIAAWCKSAEIDNYQIINDLGVLCSRR